MIYQICPADAGCGGSKKNKQRDRSLRKEPEMAYKKPEVVAKSEAKQSFVGGCPTQRGSLSCTPSGRCQVAPTR